MYKNKDFLHENFVKNGATPRYIAKKIGCSRNTVKDALEKMDLLNKDTFKPQKSPSTCYGKKRIKGVLVDHLGELRIIKRMLELRNDGLSYRKIATHLNNNNVPTKKKYGSWDSTTVRMIINRTNSKDSN